MATSPSKLYTPRLLALSADLARFPLAGEFDKVAGGRSRTCGSTITIGADFDATSKVTRIGMQVTACAVGQSSAAIMALAAEGRSARDFTDILSTVERWLETGSDMPDWPGFDALEPALPHKGRHGAILLPWKAMADALSSE